MGLEKRQEFDISREPLFEAVGYSEETMQKELEPRAALLANQIVDGAGTCPTMAIEILMESPVLRDTLLDNRDRAMIVLLAGPAIASVLVQAAMTDPDGLSTRVCKSKFGFEHNSGKEYHEVLNMDKEEWNKLLRYAEESVAAHRATIELVQDLQKLLDKQDLTALQKAVIEAQVIKKAATETAKQITPISAVVGALAMSGKP